MIVTDRACMEEGYTMTFLMTSMKNCSNEPSGYKKQIKNKKGVPHKFECTIHARI